MTTCGELGITHKANRMKSTSQAGKECMRVWLVNYYVTSDIEQHKKVQPTNHHSTDDPKQSHDHMWPTWHNT